MNRQFKDIIKHSGIYGLGQIVGRLASIVLLPLYTRHLSPADYGVIAILDLTSTVFAILINGGMAGALRRLHFDAQSADEENRVWWTGFGVTAALIALIVGPSLVFRHILARATLGPEISDGGTYYSLVLVTAAVGVLGEIPVCYFGTRKWSGLIVTLSLTALVLNVGLNVYFLTVLGMGITAILLGNLITMVLVSAVRFGIMARECGRFQFDAMLAVQLWKFAGPLTAALLLATAMHQADRYLLRFFTSLDQVGIYGLAYSMGQGLNSLFLIPFSTIWGVVLYDIAKAPRARDVYVAAFEYFAYALMLFLLGVSLFVKPLLRLLAPPEYFAAAPLVPIICLSFVFFSLDDHFKVPALLAKRTVSLLPGNAIGATTNIVLNALTVPRFGAAAAAWVSVVTYAIFAGVNLILGRRIERYDYPLVRCGGVLIGMILTFVACDHLGRLTASRAATYVVPGLAWLSWGLILTGTVVRKVRLGQLAAASSAV